LPKGKDVTWACLPTAETPWFRGLFKRVDPMPALERLTRDLYAVLSTEPRIALTEDH
jgi:hypothetical protein